MPGTRFSSRLRKPRHRKARRGGLLNWWILWRVPALLLIVMIVWWYGLRPIAEEQGWIEVRETFGLCGSPASGAARRDACVVDGDTVVIGFRPQQRRIRLTGFDTPELDGQCDTESKLALAARDRLHQWLGEGPFEWNGAGDPPRDRYGRELRKVRRIGADGSREYLADVMIESGLAAQSGWGAPDHNWCD